MRKSDFDIISSIVTLLFMLAIFLALQGGIKDFSKNFNSMLLALFGSIFSLLIIGLIIFIVIIIIIYLISNLIKKHSQKINEINKKTENYFNNSTTTTQSYPNNMPQSPLSNITALAEFLEKIRNIDWYQFENIVALIYKKLGYIVSKPSGARPDGGIDLIICKDSRQWAVQCKHWRTRNVGVKAIREFIGALADSGIKNGIFITLCGYTAEAKELAERNNIEILNESGIVKMIDQTEARFDQEIIEFLNDKRKFCPKCGSEMVLRTSKKVFGQKFWGCSSYPACRFTMPANE